jgi:hypothetical protein
MDKQKKRERMKKTPRNKAAAGMLAGLEAGRRQAQTDAKLEAETRRDVGLLPLESIKPRAGGLDTREPTPESVADMAESVEALGLLEPLVVDKRGRLLAGKTRLLALRLLAEKDGARWERVPVRRLDLDAQAEPERALAVEVAENERRKDYTAAEIKTLAERLKAAGLHSEKGRPRKGKRALLPALGAVVGKSKRQLLRILEPEKPKREKVTYDTFLKDAHKLHRALLDFIHTADKLPLLDMTPKERRAIEQADKLALLLAAIETTEGKT